MILDPDVDVYTKTLNHAENTLKNARKQQPTENQTNTKTEI